MLICITHGFHLQEYYLVHFAIFSERNHTVHYLDVKKILIFNYFNQTSFIMQE